MPMMSRARGRCRPGRYTSVRQILTYPASWARTATAGPDRPGATGICRDRNRRARTGAVCAQDSPLSGIAGNGSGRPDLALAPRYGPPHVSRFSSAPQPSSTAKDSRESHADRAPVRQDAAPLPTRAALQLAPLLSQAAAGLTCDAVGMLRPQVAGQEWQHSVLKAGPGQTTAISPLTTDTFSLHTGG